MTEKVLRSFVNKQGVRIWYYAESPEEVTELKEVPWAIWEGMQIGFRLYTNPIVAMFSGKESWNQYAKIYNAQVAKNRKGIKRKKFSIPGTIKKWL